MAKASGVARESLLENRMTHARRYLSLSLVPCLLTACPNLGPGGNETTPDTSADGGATGSDAGDAGDTDNTPTGGQSAHVTIYQIQQGEVPEMTLVDLKDIIVTSPIYYDKKSNGNFFVAEAPGGAFSGILVYAYADVIAELDADGKLPAVGDKIDLRATYSEFFDYSELTLSAGPDITITGTGTVPAPTTVTAAEVTTGGAKSEDFEGCLIQIAGAKVTAPVADFGEFQVDGVLQVDDLFYLPSPGPKPPQDTTFTNLVGQLTYGFEEFKLAPRSCADYQGWDTCTEPVDTDTTTGANVSTTIYEIQMGNVPDKSYVDLKDVVVTSQFFTDAKANGGFFIAEQPGGEYSGIQVYVYADVAAALTTMNLVPKLGDVVTISGQYSEFFDYSEISLSKVENLSITGTAAVPDAAVVAPADIATGGAKSEAYEGVLVAVEDVTVTAPVAMYGEFSVTGDLVVDDLFFAPEPGPNPMMGDLYARITGLLTYSFEVFKLEPRDLADLQKAP